MRRGFTVLEIMIAMLVISMGIVALYSMQVVAIEGNVTAQEITQATQLAERWAERMRRESITWTARPPALLEPSDDNGDWRDATSEMVNKDFISRTDDPQVIDPRYCIKYRVSTVPRGEADPRVLRVDVRVVWPRRDSGIADFLTCPPTMLQPNYLRHTWQVSLPTLLYRHQESS